MALAGAGEAGLPPPFTYRRVTDSESPVRAGALSVVGGEFGRVTLVVGDTGAYLGAALVGLVNASGRARVVLGGGVIDGLPDPLASMAARVVREARAPRYVWRCRRAPRPRRERPSPGAAMALAATRSGVGGAVRETSARER